MARQGILEKNPLAYNSEDLLLIDKFKIIFARMMDLQETGEGEETPLIMGELHPALHQVSDKRRIDALATIMSARAVEALEQLISRPNRREDLLKKSREITQG